MPLKLSCPIADPYAAPELPLKLSQRYTLQRLGPHSSYLFPCLFGVGTAPVQRALSSKADAYGAVQRRAGPRSRGSQGGPIRPSSSFIRERGTLPAASHRSAMSRKARLAASMRVA